MDAQGQEKAGGEARKVRVVVGWVVVGVCILGYVFCVLGLKKVLDLGSNYDDGFAGQPVVMGRAIGYLAVMFMASLVMLTTACAWMVMDKRVWGVLMATGVAVIAAAQWIPPMDYAERVPEFLRGVEARLKSESVDYGAIRAWAALPDGQRAKTIPELTAITRMTPGQYLRVDMHHEEPNTVVYYWGGTWAMWGVMVGPVNMSTPKPHGPMGDIRQVEPGVFVCFGSS